MNCLGPEYDRRRNPNGVSGSRAVSYELRLAIAEPE